VVQSARTRPAEDQDDPRRWRGPSALIDLEDPKLRLRVRAITQLCNSEREKALAIYTFVKRMPISQRIRLRQSKPRDVLAAGRGDAPEKALLLVAMLRAAGLPARMRYICVRGEILRGIASSAREAFRPLVEVWLQGRWLQDDTYIFDAAYMAAARQKLKGRGWDWGYGIHVDGAMLWDGYGSAYVGGAPTAGNPMVVGDLGVYSDPLQFLASRSFTARRSRLARLLQWTVLAPLMERAFRAWRQDSGAAALRSRSPS
jgi:transglutaminase-like putative cysteine protease